LITGTVTEDGVPMISMEIAGSVYSGVVDTGFNGDLELPETLRSQVNARLLCRAKSLLAGGITIDEDLYLVDFPFDGRRLRSQATFVDGEDILIGTRLLRGYRLSINFVTHAVRLQRLE
jgi:predicted aspartyl protease